MTLQLTGAFDYVYKVKFPYYYLNHVNKMAFPGVVFSLLKMMMFVPLHDSFLKTQLEYQQLKIQSMSNSFSFLYHFRFFLNAHATLNLMLEVLFEFIKCNEKIK